MTESNLKQKEVVTNQSQQLITINQIKQLLSEGKKRVLLNRQLDRLGYETLGDLVKDLLLGKITYLTEGKQIEAMKINMQGSVQNTLQLGAHYDFYKNIDIDDLLKEFMKRYHPRTAWCFVSYFRKYADIFFGNSPDVFKLKPHKRSWILQSIKKLEITISGNIILEIFRIWLKG